MENTQQFLNLQRAYAGEIYCTFNARGLNKIIATLEASKIKPEQVNPAIWGMFLAKNITESVYINKYITLEELQEIYYKDMDKIIQEDNFELLKNYSSKNNDYEIN